MFGGAVGHLLDETVLELTRILHALFLHERATVGIVLPGDCRTFVTADVYIRIREKFRELIDHVLAKLDRCGIGHIQHVA